jgi:RNA polymerase subunit RPABC4/transcription elongation factor Spt4
LVMGACTRCLTYVMLHKSDPKCPRCESEVPLDSFIAPPSSKRQKLET